MSLNGIEAAVGRAVQQLSDDQNVQREASTLFLKLLDRIVNDPELVNRGTHAQSAAPTAHASATMLWEAVRSGTAPSTHGSSAAASSLLREPALAPLEQLPNDLTAESNLYNDREAMLRERLNLPEIEARLRSAAEALDIEYHPSDLEGILRNAGYGATHLGSSARYMDAVEQLIGEAEDRYRERSSNVPGTAA